MRLLRNPILIGVLLFSLLAVYGYRAYRAQTAHAQKPISYTVYKTTVMTDGKGARTTINSLLASRADGSSIHQNIVGIPSGGVALNTMLVDSQHHLRIKWNSQTRKKVTTMLADQEIARAVRYHTSPTCSDVYDLPKRGTGPQLVMRDQPTYQGPAKVAGIDVAVYSRDDATATWSYFYAPSLNCLLLKQAEQWKDTGGTTIAEATHVVLGEPQETLFAVPADIEEVLPSAYELELWHMRSPGTDMPAKMHASMARADENYQKSRALAQQKGIGLPAPQQR